MTYQETVQLEKATALNAILKLFHPLYEHNYTYYPGEGSFREQRDEEIEAIVEKLDKRLKHLKAMQNFKLTKGL